jgi:hypothetical protein
MFYPESGFDHCPIPDPEGKKAPYPGADLFLYTVKAINKFCLLIPDPTIAPSRIRGVKKHRIPDPEHWLQLSSFSPLSAIFVISFFVNGIPVKHVFFKTYVGCFWL